MVEDSETTSGKTGDADSSIHKSKAYQNDQNIFQSLCGAAAFAALFVFLQLNLIPYGINYLSLSSALAASLAFISSIGLGIGKILSDRLSGRDIELGIIPAGSFLLAVSLLSLGLLPAGSKIFLPAILLAGLGGGLFIAPIDSFMQRQARSGKNISTISLHAGLAGVLLGAGLTLLTYALNLTPGTGFIITGTSALVLTGVALRLLPDFFMRLVALILTRLFYKIRIEGASNMPIEGPALLVCNHISYSDALILIATQRRRLRFLITRATYEGWSFATPIFKLWGCIPVRMTDPPKKIVASLQTARQALDDGFVVVIFAEGGLTRTGMLREFRKGFTKIVKNTSHPIIPVYIGGAWETFSSYFRGRFVKKWKGFCRHDISVIFGKPMPASSSAAEVRLAVMELSCDYFNRKKTQVRNIGIEFIKAARKNWSLLLAEDSGGNKLTGGALLIGAMEFADQIKSRTIDQQNVGILLPPSIAGALANFAVILTGKTPVNLDHSSTKKVFDSSIEQCGIRTIITSRAFLQNTGGPQLPDTYFVYIEDLVSRPIKTLSPLKALLSPAAWLIGGKAAGPDDTAAIVFSSGTTAAPKAVMLSHHNIISDIESLRLVLDLTAKDKIFSALPLSHAFGCMATLWYPLLSGLPVMYHSNPIEAGTVARLIRKTGSTALFSTPTLLSIYARRAQKKDFASLRRVFTGSEKLDTDIAGNFETKFGLRPLEGYGSAELSPVAILSVPHADKDQEFQTGWKAGATGRPLPGIAIKIVDPVTGANLPEGRKGMLQIKGPNVMKGYLNRPDLTAAAIKNGWYATSDVASMDEEGFVTVEDRIERFTVIAGEFIPHSAIEKVIQYGLGLTRRAAAVVSIPDFEGKDRLIVLHTIGTSEQLRGLVTASALPDSYKPGPDDYCKVKNLPMMNGKLNLPALRQKAIESISSS